VIYREIVFNSFFNFFFFKVFSGRFSSFYNAPCWLYRSSYHMHSVIMLSLGLAQRRDAKNMALFYLVFE
jgi:hypothetical protein